MTHVLELSCMYPSPRNPNSGVFIERQVRELSRIVPLDVVSPVPWAPRVLWPLSRRWRGYGRQPRETRCHDVPVHHPRYLQPIGQWSIPVAGVSMSLGAGRAVRRIVAERGSEVIHVHRLLPEGLAGVLLGARLGLPVVCTLHGGDATTAPFHDPLARRAARLVARRCRALVAASGNLLEALARIGPAGGPTPVIAYGVDGTQFQPVDRGEARARLGLRGDERVVLYAGRLTACTGVDVLLAAFARLATRRADLHLVLVGGTVERDDRRTALARRAAAFGCAGLVTFVGPRPHGEIPLWLSAADVLASASRGERIPNVVREAIACGTPCVVTARPGIADVVGPEAGILVPRANAATFAAALAEALELPWDRAAIRGRANGWRWSRNAADTLAVLREAAGERRAA